jgi:hypothetical protein
MYEKSLADSSDLWIVQFSPWIQVSRPTSCLTTAFPKTLLSICVLLSSACMSESPGQKKLRLTKIRLKRELRERTAVRCSQLRLLSEGRAVATDIEDKSTQCSDSLPWLYFYLFCFLLFAANLLFIQWFWLSFEVELEGAVLFPVFQLEFQTPILTSLSQDTWSCQGVKL